MFNPSSVSPFVKDVPHYYTPASFEPPTRLEPPTRPQDWVSFNALDTTGADSFEAFKASPRFEQAHQQFLERIDQCEDFAREHCTPEDTEKILEGFETFRRHLNENRGETFFGDVLSNLYGPGKRQFDSFCLRLQQDLDLHQRKTALRELASQLHQCRSGGPAFDDAAWALDRAPCGLKGEFHDLLMQHIDALLKEVANRPQAQSSRHGGDYQEWLATMEVHVVNRLKMELGLPNSGDSDHFAHGHQLVEPHQIGEARELLREALRPVMLAKALAERYVMALRSKLPAALLEPGANLNDDMRTIEEAHRQLSATYGPVDLHHLLVMDEETEEVHWQKDRSMLSLQLLEELARQGLIVEQPNGSLLRTSTHGNVWDLLHVDWRLFVVAERPSAGAPPSIGPVQMRHALELVRQVPGIPLCPALTESVLTDRPDELQRFPAAWLTDESICADLCRSLGVRGLQKWIETLPPRERSASPVLLPVLTDLGMVQALLTVMRWSPIHETVRRAVPSKILHRAFEQTSGHIREMWLRAIERAIPKLDPDDVTALFPPTDNSVVNQALQRAGPLHIERVLNLLVAAHQRCRFSPGKLETLLNTQFHHILQQGKIEALDLYAQCVSQLAYQNVLSNEAVFRLLGGQASLGCSDALRSGEIAIVKWYGELMILLFRRNVLGYHHLAALLRSTPPGQASGAFEALRNRHAPAFSMYFDCLRVAIHERVFLAEEIPELFACRDAQGRPGLITMLQDAGVHPCLKPWLHYLQKVARCKALTEPQLLTLLASREANGTHLLLNLFAVHHSLLQAKRWLSSAHWLQDNDVLDEQAVVSLLDGFPRHPANLESSVLLDLMHADRPPEWVPQLLELFGFAHTRYELPEHALAQLLVPIQSLESDHSVNALQRIRSLDGHVRSMLEGLVKLGRDGHLDGGPLLMLLHAIARLCMSPLTAEAAADIQTLIGELLHTDLATSNHRRIRGRFWGELLLHHGGPTREAPSSDVARKVAGMQAQQILQILNQAVTLAEQRRMIGSSGAAHYLRSITRVIRAHGLLEKPPLPPKPPRVAVASSEQGAAASPVAQAEEPPPVPPRLYRRRLLNTDFSGGPNGASAGHPPRP